ncbi:putative cadmium/zinc-transporting ATPase HMA1 [Arachis hypogaea]|nr:putative cadmium/zinc-transporting ATPase HMA1 [Arachis hypogaea]
MRRRWDTLLCLVTLASALVHLLPGSSPPLRDSVSCRRRCRRALIWRGSPSLLPSPCQTLLRRAWSLSSQKQTKLASTPLSSGGGGLLVSAISSVGQLPSDDKLPNTFNLVYKSVPMHDVIVGSYILVGAGEIVDIGKILTLFMEFQTLGDRT